MEEQLKSSAMNERQETIKRLLKMNPREFWQRAEAMERVILRQSQEIKQEKKIEDIL